MEKEKIYPLFGLFVGILAVSTAAILIRFAQDQAPSLVIASMRLLIATLAISPVAIIKYKRKLFQIRKQDFIFIALSGLFLAIHFAAWITSLEFTSIASSVVLVTTTPLWVALFSPLLLKEKNNPSIWIGLILAIIGSSFVALSNQCFLSKETLIVCQNLQIDLDLKTLIGNFLALFGAWMAAGYMMAGRKVRSNIPLVIYIFYVYLFSTIFLLIFTFISGYTLTGYSPETYWYLLLLGLIPQLLGHSIFNWALGHLPAVFVSIALIGEPIGTIILAFIFLQESPKGMEYLGGILILLGIFVVSFLKVQKPVLQKVG
jgi:drug/metabolite transporter (DMT)-like permease